MTDLPYQQVHKKTAIDQLGVNFQRRQSEPSSYYGR